MPSKPISEQSPTVESPITAEGSSPALAMPKPRPPKWSIVGQPADAIQYITAHHVEQIHWILVDDFAKSKDPIDPPVVKSRDLLESAVHRTRTSLGNEAKYPTVPMVAAALLHAIISNHAFHNGNKRTALVATLAFLDVNGFVLEVDENELFDYLVKIASHEVVQQPEDADDEMLAIARWIHRHCRSISTEEKVLKFHDLRTILLRYDCAFDHPGGRGNRINISRGTKNTQVYYRNEGTDVERNTIRQIRKDLGLTDAEGYDSAIFYKAEDRVPAFIHKYRRTLDRLAKV
jgi:death-on-curing family protein